MMELGDFSAEGLALLSPDEFKILQGNRRFREFFPSLEVPGDSFLGSLSPSLAEDFQAARAKGALKWSSHFEVKAPKGRPIPVKMTVESLTDRESQGHMLVRIIDETEIRKKDLLMKSVGDMLDFNKRRAEEARRNFKAMLDRLPQGFLVFDSQGVISPDYSAQMEFIFGDQPLTGSISDLLRFDSSQNELLSAAFQETGGYLCLEAMPREYHIDGKILETTFTPIVEDDKLKSVMVAISDATEVRALREALDVHERLAKKLYAILSHKTEFLETLELVDSLRVSMGDSMETRRKVHTLKGDFSFLECHDLARLCHHWESQWRSTEYTEESGRNFFGELLAGVDTLLNENKDILKITRGRGISEIAVETQSLLELYHRIKRLPADDGSKRDVLDTLESLISPNLESVLGWLQKPWDDALARLGKTASRIRWDSSLRVFPGNYKELFKSLIHLVRNAADHGIELPDERIEAGKSGAGSLFISASIVAGKYQLCFKDDGQGIDPVRLREVAERSGMSLDPALGREDLLQLIFEPEFSSRVDTTELSGRGLGLNIVKKEVKALNGDIRVESEIGKGTTFTLVFPKLPLPVPT